MNLTLTGIGKCISYSYPDEIYSISHKFLIRQFLVLQNASETEIEKTIITLSPMPASYIQEFTTFILNQIEYRIDIQEISCSSTLTNC